MLNLFPVSTNKLDEIATYTDMLVMQRYHLLLYKHRSMNMRPSTLHPPEKFWVVKLTRQLEPLYVVL
jgi:hypothetical protein